MGVYRTAAPRAGSVDPAPSIACPWCGGSAMSHDVRAGLRLFEGRLCETCGRGVGLARWPMAAYGWAVLVAFGLVLAFGPNDGELHPKHLALVAAPLAIGIAWMLRLSSTAPLRKS